MSWTQKLKLALARGDYQTTDTIIKKLGLSVSAIDNDTKEPLIFIAVEFQQNKLLEQLLHSEELLLKIQVTTIDRKMVIIYLSLPLDIRMKKQ